MNKVEKKFTVDGKHGYERIKPLLLIILSILLTCACSKDYKEIQGAGNIEIKVSPIEIVNIQAIEKAVVIIGYTPRLNEVYLLLLPESGAHVIGIFDTEAGKMKKEISLRSGGFQSPTDCYNPRYVQFLNDRYFLVDQWDKILVFDSDFNHLYSSMFHQYRYFIDFFNHNDRTRFFFGKTICSRDEKYWGCGFQVYELPERKKPKHIETLHKSPMNESVSHLNTKHEKKYNYIGQLFPHHYGFFKNGKLYWSEVTDNRYFVYDLDKQETSAVPLPYLKKKRFTKKNAAKAGRYMNSYFEKKFFKKFGKKFVYPPYPGDQYYFGLYDIGADKIGIVGDIDLDRVEIRLDIFDTDHRYIESIRLPVGKQFLNNLDYASTEGFRNYIDIDRGILMVSEIREDDYQYFVKIIRFEKQ